MPVDVGGYLGRVSGLCGSALLQNCAMLKLSLGYLGRVWVLCLSRLDSIHSAKRIDCGVPSMHRCLFCRGSLNISLAFGEAFHFSFLSSYTILSFTNIKRWRCGLFYMHKF